MDLSDNIIVGHNPFKHCSCFSQLQIKWLTFFFSNSGDSFFTNSLATYVTNFYRKFVLSLNSESCTINLEFAECS